MYFENILYICFIQCYAKNRQCSKEAENIDFTADPDNYLFQFWIHPPVIHKLSRLAPATATCNLYQYLSLTRVLFLQSIFPVIYWFLSKYRLPNYSYCQLLVDEEFYPPINTIALCRSKPLFCRLWSCKPASPPFLCVFLFSFPQTEPERIAFLFRNKQLFVGKHFADRDKVCLPPVST